MYQTCTVKVNVAKLCTVEYSSCISPICTVFIKLLLGASWSCCIVFNGCRETARYAGAWTVPCSGLDWTQAHWRSWQLMETLVQLNYFVYRACLFRITSLLAVPPESDVLSDIYVRPSHYTLQTMFVYLLCPCGLLLKNEKSKFELLWLLVVISDAG